MDTAELKTLLTNAHATTPSGKIVRVLSQRGALSGARIAGITGLAKSTVSTTLAELRKSGIIVDDAGSKSDAPASVGRPGNTVTLNPLAGTCVGVLLGVQHIQVVIADVSHAVLAEKLFYIDPDYSPARAAEVIKALIAEACDELGISQRTILGVGMALAAPVNPLDGRILRAGGIPTWTGVDIRAEFEPVLGARVFADNESNCSAIAEMMWGAAVGHEDFVFVTLDIGVGGAIVHRGHLLTGIAGAAGEFGHMSINPGRPALPLWQPWMPRALCEFQAGAGLCGAALRPADDYRRRDRARVRRRRGLQAPAPRLRGGRRSRPRYRRLGP